MSAVILLALLEFAGITLDDCERFPSAWICREQIALCATHRQRLLVWRGVHGYQDGRWDAWLDETDFRATYYRLALNGHVAPWGHGPGWRLGQLERLRHLIGHADYQAGWSPVPWVDVTPKREERETNNMR